MLVDKIPTAGIELIKEFEGYEKRLADGSGQVTSYPDAIHGWGLPTIGYGTTKYPNGSKVKQGDIITESRAEECLQAEIVHNFQPHLEKIPTWKNMNENQRGALYSFAYNLGADFYGGRNFASITQVCNCSDRWGDKAWITEQFVKYCNPGTSAEAGLKRRRLREAELFCTPVENNPIEIPGQSQKYVAIHKTFLKKKPVQSSTLADNAKVVVEKGKIYSVIRRIQTDGLNAQLELDYEAGIWWIFLPHWHTLT